MEPNAKSHRILVAVEFRNVSGNVLARGSVWSDATVADFNKILEGRGINLPAGSTYVNGTTSIAMGERDTPVWGGIWTVVRNRIEVGVEFRNVSGYRLMSGYVYSDATVADFNEMLQRRGDIVPAGMTYVHGTTSIAMEERETPVWGGIWTLVRNSASRPGSDDETSWGRYLD